MKLNINNQLITLPDSATVYDLRQLVNQDGIFYLKYNNRLLDKSYLFLSDLGIKDNDTIIIEPNIQIQVDTTKPMLFNTLASILVFDFKRQLYSEYSIPPVNQRLYNNGVELQNNRTLKEYNITNNSIIKLVPSIPIKKINVNLIPEGYASCYHKSFTVELNNIATFRNIRKEIEKKTKIPLVNIHIYKKQCILPDHYYLFVFIKEDTVDIIFKMDFFVNLELPSGEVIIMNLIGCATYEEIMKAFKSDNIKYEIKYKDKVMKASLKEGGLKKFDKLVMKRVC